MSSPERGRTIEEREESRRHGPTQASEGRSHGRPLPGRGMLSSFPGRDAGHSETSSPSPGSDTGESFDMAKMLSSFPGRADGRAGPPPTDVLSSLLGRGGKDEAASPGTDMPPPFHDMDRTRWGPSRRVTGIFPREHLAEGETLQLEDGPDIIAHVGRWIPLALLALILIVAAHPLFLPVRPYAPILFAISAIGLFIGTLSWSHASFAISDRRIMACHGALRKKFTERDLDHISDITITMPIHLRPFNTGIITFQASGPEGGTITWYGVTDPEGVGRMVSRMIHQPPQGSESHER